MLAHLSISHTVARLIGPFVTAMLLLASGMAAGQLSDEELKALDAKRILMVTGPGNNALVSAAYHDLYPTQVQLRGRPLKASAPQTLRTRASRPQE